MHKITHVYKIKHSSIHRRVAALGLAAALGSSLLTGMAAPVDFPTAGPQPQAVSAPAFDAGQPLLDAGQVIGAQSVWRIATCAAISVPYGNPGSQVLGFLCRVILL